MAKSESRSFKKPSTGASLEMPEPGRERRARGGMFNETGALGLKHVGGFIREEYLKELVGSKGMRTIREMMDNDPIIGAFLFAVEQAIRQVDWKVIPAIAKPPEPSPAEIQRQQEMDMQMQAASDKTMLAQAALDMKSQAAMVKPTPAALKKFVDENAGGGDWREAKKYANFVDSCRLDMAMTWSDVMTEALSFLPFGWSMLETTYKVRRGYNADMELNSRYEDGLVGWKMMSPRAQESMRRWIYAQSNPDRLTHMQQFTTEKGTVDIPIARCLHFRTKAFKNNPEGRTILRNCYRPWYMKKRIEEIEGIGVERDMAGLPVMIAGEHADLWNENDPRSVAALERAERIVRNIRVDEQMGVLLPFGWDLKLLATGGKRSLNTTDIVNRYSQNMAMTVLADFILLGHTNRMGSFALAKSKTSMFAMSLVGYLNVIRDTFNTFELPRLWRMNGFPMEMMPRLDYTPVDTPSLKDLASYITALSGAQIDFTPPELQRFLLQAGGIPADITDLAGRGGTGDVDENGDGVPDDQEGVAPGEVEDDEDEDDAVEGVVVPRSGGNQGLRKPTQPPNRGVYTGRTAAGVRKTKTRFFVRRAA